MTDHIEETPEMARVRKAKAALKGAQANVAEICAANDAMSERMKSVANAIDGLAKACGDQIGLPTYQPGHSSKVFVTLRELLQREATRLREKAV